MWFWESGLAENGTAPALKLAFSSLVFPESFGHIVLQPQKGQKVPQIQVPLRTQDLEAQGVQEALGVP